MPFTEEFAATVARKHGFNGPLTKMPDSGMVNEAWLIGDGHVLRIINVDDADDEAERESIVVPMVCDAGVRAPKLLFAKTTRDNEFPPYTIYERAKGTLLGHFDTDPKAFRNAYREIGREIYFLNQIEVDESLIPILREGSTFDAKQQLEKSLAAGVLTDDDAKQVEMLANELDKLRGEPRPFRFLHQDIHPWNVFVDEQTRELTAIIDWGDAAWGDPAGEFASMPLVAIEDMFEGYIDAGGAVDESFVARSLSLGLALSLWESRDLDPARFERQWWRLSPNGWQETLTTIETVMVNWQR